MPKFLLILRGDPDEWRQRSPADIRALIERFESWAGRLMSEGRFHDGKKLADDEGRVLSRDGMRSVVTDGPFGETKELVGGIHWIEADDYQHAQRLCEDHPNLEIGGTIEIRRADELIH